MIKLTKPHAYPVLFSPVDPGSPAFPRYILLLQTTTEVWITLVLHRETFACMTLKVICTGWVWLVKVIIYRHQKAGQGPREEPGYEARLHGF